MVLSGATWIFLVRPVVVLVLGRPPLFIFCNFCVLDYQFQANSKLWRQKMLCFWERGGRNEKMGEKAGLGVGSASVCPTCCLESFVVHKTPNEEAKTAEIFA